MESSISVHKLSFRWTLPCVLTLALFAVILLWITHQTHIAAAIYSGYWDSLVTAANCSLIILGPFCAAATAWKISQLRSGGVFTYPNPRSNRSIVLCTIFPIILLTIACLVLTWCVLFPRAHSGSPSTADMLVIISGPVILVAYACFGTVLAVSLPRVAASPTALVTAFLWLAFPSAIEPMWLRRLNGFEDGCCAPHTALSVQGVAPALIFAVGTIILCCLILIIFMHTISPNIVLIASLVAVITVGSAIVLAVPFGDYPVVPRTSSMHCESANDLEICVWPEHSSELPSLLSAAHDVRSQLAASDIPVPTSLSEQIDAPWSISASGFSALNTEEQQNTLLSGLTAADTTLNGCELSETASLRYQVAVDWINQLLRDPNQISTSIDNSTTENIDSEIAGAARAELEQLPRNEQGKQAMRMIHDVQKYCVTHAY